MDFFGLLNFTKYGQFVRVCRCFTLLLRSRGNARNTAHAHWHSHNLCEILEITLSDVLNCVFKNEKTANGPARVGKSAFYVFSYVKCVMF